MTERDETLSAKCREVQEELARWAVTAEILRPGEQLIFTLSIGKVPTVVLRGEPELLAMPIKRFLKNEKASSRLQGNISNVLLIKENRKTGEGKFVSPRTVGELLACTPKDITSAQNMGWKTFLEIREILRRHNLYFSGEGPSSIPTR